MRHVLRPFTRIAIRYKVSHETCHPFKYTRPFSCACPQPLNGAFLDHVWDPLCPDEVSHFLDCFDNLKEFYLLVTPSRKEQKGIATEFLKQGGFIPPPANDCGAPLDFAPRC